LIQERFQAARWTAETHQNEEATQNENRFQAALRLLKYIKNGGEIE